MQRLQPARKTMGSPPSSAGASGLVLERATWVMPRLQRETVTWAFEVPFKSCGSWVTPAPESVFLMSSRVASTTPCPQGGQKLQEVGGSTRSWAWPSLRFPRWGDLAQGSPRLQWTGSLAQGSHRLPCWNVLAQGSPMLSGRVHWPSVYKAHDCTEPPMEPSLNQDSTAPHNAPLPPPPGPGPSSRPRAGEADP